MVPTFVTFRGKHFLRIIKKHYQISTNDTNIAESMLKLKETLIQYFAL